MLIDRIERNGWAVATAAEAQGCSSATAYKWLRRFRTEGWAGLQDRSSRPHRCPRQLSPEREMAIINHRRKALEGPHRIGWALGESASTVHKVLMRNRMPRLCDVDRATRTVVRYQRERPGELLHIDIKKQARIPDGGGWRVYGRTVGNRNSHAHSRRRTGGNTHTLGFDYLHIAVDDHSRIAYLEALADQRKETAVAFTKRAIRWFDELGICVQSVMTDNGSCYRSRGFADLLSGARIRHLRTRPYRPQTNGKVERFNLTLKTGWAYGTVYNTNQDRLKDLPNWLHYYNHHRPHMALKGMAPMVAVNNVCGNHS